MYFTQALTQNSTMAFPALRASVGALDRAPDASFNSLE